MVEVPAPQRPRRRAIFDYATDVDPVMSTFGWKAIGLTYVALVVPLLGAFFPRDAATKWSWFALSAVLALSVGLINIVHYRTMVKSDGYREPPAIIVLCEAATGTIATALMAYAIGGTTGIYRPMIFIPTLLIAMIGNRSMVLVSWVVATVSVTWVGLATGAIDDNVVAFVISYGATWGVASIMVHSLAMNSLHSDSQINGLADAAGIIARANGLEDGVGGLLPLIGEWSDATCVAGYLLSEDDSDQSRIEPLGVWPPTHAVTADAGPPTGDELAATLDAQGVSSVAGRSMIAARGADGDAVAIVIDEPATYRLNALMKRFNLQRMALQLDTLMSRSRYIEQLEVLGRTDGLTGLPNRRALQTQLALARNEARRREEAFTLVMIDLDRFKVFNDSFGHVAGDELLRVFADELRTRLRAVDFVARYGGEEFCMILPGTDAAGAEQLLMLLHEGFRAVDGIHGVTFSAGIAQWDGVEDADALVNRADQALYDAKATGRDRSVVHARRA